MIESILTLMFPLHGLNDFTSSNSDLRSTQIGADTEPNDFNFDFSSHRRNMILFGEDSMYFFFIL